MPAIPEFWKTVHWGDVGAPFCNANEDFFAPMAQRIEVDAWREGDDSQIVGRGRLHKKSVANVLVGRKCEVQ